MKRVLVLKTSDDKTIKKLLDEWKEDCIDCLVQADDLFQFESDCPNINFIEATSNNFYDLDQTVFRKIATIDYDVVLITLTGLHEHDFGHVLRLLEKLIYKRAYFYNCEGDYMEIPHYPSIVESLIALYMRVVKSVYKKSAYMGIRNKK